MNRLKYKQRAIDNVRYILKKEEHNVRIVIIAELLNSKKLVAEDFDFIKGQLKIINTNLSQVILNELREELDEVRDYVNNVYDYLIEMYLDNKLTEDVLEQMYCEL